MHYLRGLPEEGQVNLMVEGKILACKRLQITEDLVVATTMDDALWYLDPDRIAGFCPGEISDMEGFFQEGDWEKEILPTMVGTMPVEADTSPEADTSLEADRAPASGQNRHPVADAKLLSGVPRFDRPKTLFGRLYADFNKVPLCREYAEEIMGELTQLGAEEHPGREKAAAILEKIQKGEEQFPAAGTGFLSLGACLQSIMGEGRRSASLFLQAGKVREAIVALDALQGYQDQEELCKLIGYFLLQSQGELLSGGEDRLAMRYAELCETTSDAAIFYTMYDESLGEDGLDTASKEAVESLIRKKQGFIPEGITCGELVSLLKKTWAITEGCDTASYETVAKNLKEEAVWMHDEAGGRDLPDMPFYVSQIKARSCAGYQQAHLFFRMDAPGETENVRFREVYLNPRQVLDPLLGELIQKGSDVDLKGLSIAFTPILNDLGVAAGDAFLVRQDRCLLFPKVVANPPKWLKHEFFIRYGSRGYAGREDIAEAFTKQAADAHMVQEDYYVSDWQVFRFLRMVLCADVSGAAIPVLFFSQPALHRCATRLMGAPSLEEKNLWLSRLIYRLQQGGEEETASLILYFCYGLPRNNPFFFDLEKQPKMRKEALWVKLTGLVEQLRLCQVRDVAKDWKAAMLKDRRVNDVSALKDAHRRTWEKVEWLEKVCDAVLAEEQVDARNAYEALTGFLSDTEKGKLAILGMYALL